MILPVSLFLALAAMLLSYAIGQGGGVAGLVFLAVLMGGVSLRYAQPLLEKLKP